MIMIMITITLTTATITLIIITIGAAMVKPDMAKTAGYVALVAVVLLALMKGGGAVLDSLNSTTAVTR